MLLCFFSLTFVFFQAVLFIKFSSSSSLPLLLLLLLSMLTVPSMESLSVSLPMLPDPCILSSFLEEVPHSVLWQNRGAKAVTAVSGSQPCLHPEMCSCMHMTFL
jgi:hypothetical protein